jgi:hypothetical protein
LIIYFIPRLLEFAGYNKSSYEWDIGIAPPAVYYSQYNDWYVLSSNLCAIIIVYFCFYLFYKNL